MAKNAAIEATASKQAGRKKKFFWSRDDSELTLLSLPTVIWYIAFCYMPMFGILMAFKNFSLVSPGKSFFYNLLVSPWSGLDNFEFLAKSGSLSLVVKLTLMYNLVFMVLGIVVPVTLALLMSQLHSKKLGKVYQTAMFMPYFMSWVVVTYFVFAFLSPDKGFINSFLVQLGREPINWYMEPDYWPGLLIFLNSWKGMGYGMVVYLATITGIDGSLYEAAVIDGATKWQQARFITLPILKTVIVMMFILNVGGIVRSDFGLFYQVPKASNSLYQVTETIDVFIYKMIKTQPNPNMASAAAFLQSTIGCGMILLTNWIAGKIDKDTAII